MSNANHRIWGLEVVLKTTCISPALSDSAPVLSPIDRAYLDWHRHYFAPGPHPPICTCSTVLKVIAPGMCVTRTSH